MLINSSEFYLYYNQQSITDTMSTSADLTRARGSTSMGFSLPWKSGRSHPPESGVAPLASASNPKKYTLAN